MLGRMPQHPWANLPPEKLLRVAGFIRQDFTTGKQGYTLASALMFGFDSTIQSLVPGYKFDALLRRRDTERFDDRLIVRTNLIDVFDLLMGFVEKHLNDPFYLEGATSISLRTIIFRELVANIIAHREYTSSAPATMAIYSDRVEFKNPNVPHFHGRIDPNRFTPYSKNPTLCKFMIQIGRYEELGSGVRRVHHYLPYYAPGADSPIFNDEEIFSVTIPLLSTGEVTGETLRFFLILKNGALTRVEAQKKLALKSQANFRKLYLAPALVGGFIEMTLSDKPNSRLQKYRLTELGQSVVKKQGEVYLLENR